MGRIAKVIKLIKKLIKIIKSITSLTNLILHIRYWRNKKSFREINWSEKKISSRIIGLSW